jgi:periplasmic protein TonB
MTAGTLAWFEDEDPRELRRWSIAAAIVVGVHVGLIGGYLLWNQSDADVGDDTSVISIELTAPEVDQQEQAPVDKPPPPEVTTNDIAIPEEKPPEKVVPVTPAPRTTARVDAAAPRIDSSWQTLLVKHLQRFKSYPSDAREHNEQGVVLLAFTVDRNGHVLSRHIVKSSGHPTLDDEVMALVERAQPLPAFPASMSQASLDLTVPIRFSLQ